MKKIYVTILTIVACLITPVLLAGCGGSYDDSALAGRIAQLEKDNNSLESRFDELEQESAALAAQLTLLEGKISEGSDNKVYRTGDEFTVSSYGYDLFKIKIEQFIQPEAHEYTIRTTVTNINMPAIRCADYMAVSYLNTDGTTHTPSPTTSELVIKTGQSGPFTIYSLGHIDLKTPSKIFLGFANSSNAPFIPYAVLQP